ncbi:hypothetical protein GZ22_05775 [Terribacillus saccharophilus]|uniref:Uncharacterized protein n=1 Tax=Terribacillus saccharophilus TaxID=361277 RepID=A0A075LHP2_9BACI|nr:hypothetical protein [Terribacillus goriensis]AIF66175.1 hypothetical protein GZ22_05775 [Terribacillus goriensis]
MDLSSVYKLIDSEFKVLQREKDIICVAPVSGEDYPETTIKLTLDKVSNIYELFEVVRGNEYKVDSFSDEYKSIVALYIFSKSKLEVRKYDANVQNEIEQAKSLNHIQKIFKTNLDEQFYSFLVLKPKRILLEKGTNDKYNVLFLGKSDTKVYIDKSRKLNSAAVVLYNYSVKLKLFYNLVNIIEVKKDSDFIETLRELYLLG